MKFLAGLAVAASLASSAAAAAADLAAPVFLLRASSPSQIPSAAAAPGEPSGELPSSSLPPTLPPAVARQILFQRLLSRSDASSSFFDTLEPGYDAETALELIRQYGAATPPLFSDVQTTGATSRPRQMLVVVESVKPAQLAALEAAVAAQPAFSLASPPSPAANKRFFVDELAQAGVSAYKDVPVADAVAGGAPEQWKDGVFFGLYNAKETPNAIDDLVAALPQIQALVERGDTEVALLLLPETGGRASKAWSKDKLAGYQINRPKTALFDKVELRVREAGNFESVIVEDAERDAERDAASSAAAASDGDSVFQPLAEAPAPVLIPACFQSFNSCVAQTGNCSEHGTCVDKFQLNGGGSAAARPGGVCFVCHCFSTLNRPEEPNRGVSTTQWAGNTCQKIDVSVPFWLITGFSVTLVGAIAFAISLLFNVGEEKLPGVIGAGVSRTK